jgi:hypothetical protein
MNKTLLFPILVLAFVFIANSNDKIDKNNLEWMLSAEMSGISMSGFHIGINKNLINKFNSLDASLAGSDEIGIADSFYINKSIIKSKDTVVFTVQYFNAVENIYDSIWNVKTTLEKQIIFVKGKNDNWFKPFVHPVDLFNIYKFNLRNEYSKQSEIIIAKILKNYKEVGKKYFGE